MQLGCRLDLQGFEKMWLAVEQNMRCTWRDLREGFYGFDLMWVTDLTGPGLLRRKSLRDWYLIGGKKWIH